MNFFEMLQGSMKKLQRRPLKFYEPGRNEPCVCGSGIKFKKCCKGKYSSEASNQYLECYNSGQYEEALLWARYKFTWYLLCHRAHTIPLIEAKLPPAAELLRVDIEALAELLGDIHRCYNRTNRQTEFQKLLEKHSEIVNDNRWKDKIIYLNALWYLIDNNDRNKAFESLEKVNIEVCVDSDILTLYIDVFPGKMDLDRKVKLIDKVINHTNIESHKLQYTTLKGVCFLLVCEIEKGCAIIYEGIEKYKYIKEDKKSSYGETFFAHALDLLGRFSKQPKLIEESINVYKNLIAVAQDKSYPNEYIGELLKCIGESNEALNRHDLAITNYTESLNLYPVELTKIFLARAEIKNGNPDAARTLLDEVNPDYLDDAGLFDRAIAYTLLAANTCKERDLIEAKTLLKEAKNDWPLFVQQRDKWLIELLETSPISEPGKFKSLLKSINKYVTLNPNIFGIGIDLNKIIEDVDRASNNKNG